MFGGKEVEIEVALLRKHQRPGWFYPTDLCVRLVRILCEGYKSVNRATLCLIILPPYRLLISLLFGSIAWTMATMLIDSAELAGLAIAGPLYGMCLSAYKRESRSFSNVHAP